MDFTMEKSGRQKISELLKLTIILLKSMVVLVMILGSFDGSI
jgi:hypothetical protein